MCAQKHSVTYECEGPSRADHQSTSCRRDPILRIPETILQTHPHGQLVWLSTSTNEQLPRAMKAQTVQTNKTAVISFWTEKLEGEVIAMAIRFSPYTQSNIPIRCIWLANSLHPMPATGKTHPAPPHRCQWLLLRSSAMSRPKAAAHWVALTDKPP